MRMDLIMVCTLSLSIKYVMIALTNYTIQALFLVQPNAIEPSPRCVPRTGPK